MIFILTIIALHCTTSSYSNFPDSYFCSKYPSISQESQVYLAGAYTFKVIDNELFELNWISLFEKIFFKKIMKNIKFMSYIVQDLMLYLIFFLNLALSILNFLFSL